jgi:hypothetical protein
MARSPGFAQPGDADFPADFPTPPTAGARERRAELLRRWWRSQGRRRNLRYWLLFRGLPVLVAFAMLYIVTGFVVGWEKAYNICLAIDPPTGTSSPVLAWALSLAGWLVMPGVAGAVAGYVVSDSIGSRRSRSLPDSFPGSGITRKDLRDILRELDDE